MFEVYLGQFTTPYKFNTLQEAFNYMKANEFGRHECFVQHPSWMYGVSATDVETVDDVIRIALSEPAGWHYHKHIF